MSDSYIGEVRLFAGDYAPEGWAICNGQLLSLNNYQALFTLLGTTYGGDGATTFGLPDLRGRVVVGTGQGNGLTNRVAGQSFGTQASTIGQSNMPSHGHDFHANATAANEFGPGGGASSAFGTFATQQSIKGLYSKGGTKPNVTLNPAAVSTAYGGGLPHNNMMGTLTLNYIICLEGFFPTQG